MRAIHGTYRRIDPDAIIEVLYLRATPLTVSAQSKAQNRAVTAAHAVMKLTTTVTDTQPQPLSPATWQASTAAAPTSDAHGQKPRP